MADTVLERVDETFGRLLAVVAHPDDLEYGAASAIARWTGQGRQVGYVIVTDGEAGIDHLAPRDAGPVRRGEQTASAATVGVDWVEFLGHPDGVVEGGPALRRDIARQIRRFRPDVLLIATHDLTFGDDMVNQSDHRAVGLAALDAAKDAGNRWIFPELIDEGHEPWAGTEFAYAMGSDRPTHGVDVTAHLTEGVASLQAHQTYIDGLGRAFDADAFVRGFTARQGPVLGVPNAVLLRRFRLASL